MLYYTLSKEGEDDCELVDESRQDISGLAQTAVIPLAEKSPSKLASAVKLKTDRMSQRRFSDPGGAVDPVYIAVLLLRFFGRPLYELFEGGFAGAVHTA